MYSSNLSSLLFGFWIYSIVKNLNFYSTHFYSSALTRIWTSYSGMQSYNKVFVPGPDIFRAIFVSRLGVLPQIFMIHSIIESKIVLSILWMTRKIKYRTDSSGANKNKRRNAKIILKIENTSLPAIESKGTLLIKQPSFKAISY